MSEHRDRRDPEQYRSVYEDIARIAGREGGKQAVNEVLSSFGFDTGNILETQKDVAHMRASRKLSERTRIMAISAAVTMGLSGAAYALWEGIKSVLRGGGS